MAEEDKLPADTLVGFRELMDKVEEPEKEKVRAEVGRRLVRGAENDPRHLERLKQLDLDKIRKKTDNDKDQGPAR